MVTAIIKSSKTASAKAVPYLSLNSLAIEMRAHKLATKSYINRKKDPRNSKSCTVPRILQASGIDPARVETCKILGLLKGMLTALLNASTLLACTRDSEAFRNLG